MVVFSVYEPPLKSGDRFDRAERLAFIKDGFIWTAALFPALWLLFKRLWLELLVFLALIAGVTWAAEALGAAKAFSGMLIIVIQIVIGFEAPAILGAALERRGWRFAGTVAGRDRLECERRFLEEWLTKPSAGSTPADGGRGRIASWTATAWNGLRGRRAPLGAKA